MGSSGHSGVSGRKLWTLGLLVSSMCLCSAATLTAFQGRKFGSAGSGRRLPPIGSARRMSSPGADRNLPSPGSGRRITDQGAGRRLADPGAGRRLAPLGSADPSLPPALKDPRRGGGLSNHGSLQGAVFWPDHRQTNEGDPNPATREPERQLDSSHGEIDESGAAGEVIDGRQPLPPQPRAQQPMEELADQLARTARRQLSQGQVYLAEASLNSAVSLFPSDPIMRIEYALALSSVGNFHGAVNELINGFRLAPELMVESLNVVAVFGGRERFAERMEQIDRYRAAFPLDSNSLFLRAFLALHSGAREEARRDFLLLKSKDPGFPFLSAFTKRLSLIEQTPPTQEALEGDSGDDFREAPDGQDR